MTREIDSIYDLEENDVALAREFAQLCEGLAEYADEREEYKLQSFDAARLETLGQAADDIYKQLAVVIAYKQDREIDPSDIGE